MCHTQSLQHIARGYCCAMALGSKCPKHGQAPWNILRIPLLSCGLGLLKAVEDAAQCPWARVTSEYIRDNCGTGPVSHRMPWSAICSVLGYSG